MELLDLACRFEVTVMGHKFVEIAELLGFKIIQKDEELFSVVLDWGARQKQNTAAWMLLEQQQCLSLLVLEPVGLVNDHILEGNLLEHVRQVCIEDLV